MVTLSTADAASRPLSDAARAPAQRVPCLRPELWADILEHLLPPDVQHRDYPTAKQALHNCRLAATLPIGVTAAFHATEPSVSTPEDWLPTSLLEICDLPTAPPHVRRIRHLLLDALDVPTQGVVACTHGITAVTAFVVHDETRHKALYVPLDADPGRYAREEAERYVRAALEALFEAYRRGGVAMHVREGDAASDGAVGVDEVFWRTVRAEKEARAAATT
ncbi:hypothetical protein JCM10449v2_003537 [Rhodotorula kratochvilovae]